MVRISPSSYGQHAYAKLALVVRVAAAAAAACSTAQAGAQSVCVPGGLVAYYPFTGNAIDATGNGHDGTINGAVLIADQFGRSNSAFLFNGSALITVADAPDLGYDTVTGQTIAAWVFRNNTGTQHIMGKRVNCLGPATTTPFWQLAIGSGALAEAQVPLNQWVHLAQVTVGPTLTYYVNGVFSSSQAFPYGTFNPATTFIIGGSGTCGGRFVGGIDEVRIYNRVLSPSEIMALATRCPADFNCSGGQPTVQDIFDFLAAYFAGSLSADFNGAAGLGVQDIFDYLAAYFAGCP